MKRKILLLVFFFMFTSLASNANATFIETSASDIDGIDQTYSYNFKISQTDNSLVYAAELTNTSLNPSDSLIWLLAFNMTDGELDDNFWIVDVNPEWNFRNDINGVEFEYVGDTIGTPNNRLHPQYKDVYPSSLTFNFRFHENFVFPTDPFSIWTDSAITRGKGIVGDGDKEGQVAVFFQNIGFEGKDSDTLVSNWNGDGGGGGEVPIPEPSTILLLLDVQVF